MLREHLSAQAIHEQMALGSFETRSVLNEKSQMGFGTLPYRLDWPKWEITNQKLLNRWRYMEMINVLNQVRVEFADPNELSRMFQQMGVCTQNGDIYEMYLGADDLLCDYCLQVNMDREAPVFVKVLAYAKDALPFGKYHRH